EGQLLHTVALAMNAPPLQPLCAGCQQRDREIAQLRTALAEVQQQVAGLQQQLETFQREGKRQAAPFRRRKRVDNPKKPGRPEGHAAAARPIPEQVDRILEAPMEVCPDCQVPLENRTVYTQYQT